MALAAVALLLASCVTQSDTPTRGIRVKPDSTRPATADRAAPTLPSGPVARPAATVSSSAAIRLTLFPLGNVLYDGQTLPLASPDGKFLAVQSGEAPAWPTILAEDGQEPSTRTTLRVFDVSGANARLVSSVELSAWGLMLGRAADTDGFLVESPQRDGARWIGKVGWHSGKVEWIVQDAAVNAHAILVPGGGVAWTRRPIGGKQAALIFQRESGQPPSVRDAGEGSYWYPMVSGEPGVLFALRTHAAGTDLEAIRLADNRLDAVILTRTLAGTNDPLLAHQIAMTATTAVGGGAPAPLACLSPRHGRMAVFNLGTGMFEPLASKTVAVIPSPDPRSPGFFCTTNEALVYVPKIGTGDAAGAAPPVLTGAYVPRAAWTNPPSLLLVGPVRGQADRLELVRVVVGESGGG
ncbi:MAG: hypothetical protein HBSAPP03_27710 [Phycisphaerae bacterium]|nr:MAG: hypothetical protein HBSAPP03_27710 [Phycisphaerae bacterium]